VAAFYNCYALDPNGKPLFDAKGNPDFRKGDIYVSVSTILGMEGAGDFLTKWLLSTFGARSNPIEAYDSYMKKVSSLGSRLHAYFEADMLGKPMPDGEVTEDMLPGIESYHLWKSEHDVEVIDLEKVLHSKKYRIAGTRDLKVKIDGQLYIADWKTGSVQDKAFAQLAMYCYMGREMGEADNVDAKLLVLGGADSKTKIADGGAIQMHTLESWFSEEVTQADMFAWFQCLRHLWDWKNIKSRKFSPVIKDMQKIIDPMIERFKASFSEAVPAKSPGKKGKKK
jgi:hypothetical protein